jgi:hypothetical protein
MSGQVGQSTVEFALSVVFLAAFLLFAVTVIDYAHMRVVADQAARVAARAAVYSWDDDAKARALEVWRNNPGILPGTRAMEPEITYTDAMPNANTVTGLLRVFSRHCYVTVTCYVPVPLLGGSTLFDPDDKLRLSVSSTVHVNRWNAGVLFYVPVKVPSSSDAR